MTKLKLSVKDRLNLPGILPREGSLIEREIMDNIKTRVKLSPGEIERLNFRNHSGGGVIWDEEKEKIFEAKFHDSEIKIMKTGVDQLDKQKKVTDRQYNLCKRINALKI